MTKDITIPLNAEPSPEQRAAVLTELRRALLPPPPVPIEALQLLRETATGDTGGSQAVRNFLFWLAGQPDPTRAHGCGGLELRRLDREHKDAALELLRWWSGPTQTDEPLYRVLGELRFRFAPAVDGPTYPVEDAGQNVDGAAGNEVMDRAVVGDNERTHLAASIRFKIARSASRSSRE